METTPTPKRVEKSRSDRKKGMQERFMLVLTLAFFVGVILYSVLPEGVVRGVAMGLFSCLVYWSIFKYAM